MRYLRFVLVLSTVAAAAAPGPAGAGSPATALADATAQSSVGTWTGAMVDSTRDVGTSMGVAVVPGLNTVLVSYYDQAEKHLWVAAYAGSAGNCGPGGSWFCQLVDSSDSVGAYSAIAVTDSSIIIAYSDYANGALKVATAPCIGEGCSWVTSTVDRRIDSLDWVGPHVSMAWEGSGSAGYITYQVVRGLGVESVRVASPRPTGDGNCGVGEAAGYWQCDTIMNGNDFGQYTATVIDALHRPQIAFYDHGSGKPYHAMKIGSGGNCGPGGSWLCDSPSLAGHDSGASTSLWTEHDGTPNDGTPHLAYIDATAGHGELIYATYVGLAGNCGYSDESTHFEWWCEVVDSDIGPVGTARTVAMTGSSGEGPLIAYRDASSELGPAALMIAQPVWAAPPGSTANCGPEGGPYGWVCTQLDGGGTWVDEAAGVAFAESPDVRAIAYHELDDYFYPAEGNLKVLTSPTPLFQDGFETGGTTLWSSSVP